MAEKIQQRRCEASISTGLLAVPEWVRQLETIDLSVSEVDSLPEYSASLPDSYKRPISEGGRPWKRDLNFFGKFAPRGEKIWIYCEYIPDPDPKMLGILSKLIVSANAEVCQPSDEKRS